MTAHPAASCNKTPRREPLPHTYPRCGDPRTRVPPQPGPPPLRLPPPGAAPPPLTWALRPASARTPSTLLPLSACCVQSSELRAGLKKRTDSLRPACARLKKSGRGDPIPRPRPASPPSAHRAPRCPAPLKAFVRPAGRGERPRDQRTPTRMAAAATRERGPSRTGPSERGRPRGRRFPSREGRKRQRALPRRPPRTRPARPTLTACSGRCTR